MKSGTFPYSPLHLRSYFSLLKGCVSPEDLCAAAAAQGFAVVGMADLNNFYGLIRFVNAARRYDVTPVAGVVLAPGGEYLCTLYWKNLTGFGRINRILSRVLTDEYRRRKLKRKAGEGPYPAGPSPSGGEWYDPVQDLAKEGWEDVVVVSSRKDVLARLVKAAVFPRDLYAALFYGRPFADFARWARENKVPLIALNDGVYGSPEDRNLYRLLRAVD